MNESEKGFVFVEGLEGRVHKAYKDSVGVVTIGIGFTMRSAIFASYWRLNRGHDLRLGDTISDAEIDMLFRRMMSGEYTEDVDAKAKPKTQYQFDACGSVCWNAGPGSLGDAWARALAAGHVTEAANLLRSYKLTHGLLVRRRRLEADLLENGDYGAPHTPATAPSVSQTPAEVREYQTQLKALGIYRGAIDGVAGPATTAAVISFQASHPDLVADGIVGPATRAVLAATAAAKAPKPTTSPNPANPTPNAPAASAGGFWAAVLALIKALIS